MEGSEGGGRGEERRLKGKLTSLHKFAACVSHLACRRPQAESAPFATVHSGTVQQWRVFPVVVVVDFLETPSSGWTATGLSGVHHISRVGLVSVHFGESPSPNSPKFTLLFPSSSYSSVSSIIISLVSKFEGIHGPLNDATS